MINIEKLWKYVDSRVKCENRMCGECKNFYNVNRCPGVSDVFSDEEREEIAALLKQCLDKKGPEITEDEFIDILMRDDT